MSKEESRGQLILVGGVTIAVLLISIGIVFNTALYTQAQSTSNTFSDTLESENYKHEMKQNIGDMITTENKQMDDTANTGITKSINTINTYSSDRQSEYGVITRITHNTTTTGERAAWTNTTKPFENPDNNTTWKVTNNIESIRQYYVKPKHTALFSASNPSATTLESSAFGITFNPDGADTVTRYIYRNGSKVVIRGVNNANDITMTCSIENENTTIQLTNDAVNNKFTTNHCNNLWPNTDVNTIQYENGDNMKGEFAYTAQATTTSHSAIDIAQSVYAVTIDYKYNSPDVTHTATTRIAPGEP